MLGPERREAAQVEEAARDYASVFQALVCQRTGSRRQRRTGISSGAALSFGAMPASDWVPIASVIATAAVGLGVPIITARYDRDRIRAQAEEGRRDELRGVIDEAGASITAALFALDQAVTEARRDLAPYESGPRGRLSFSEFIERARPALHEYRNGSRWSSATRIDLQFACRRRTTSTSPLAWRSGRYTTPSSRWRS